MSVKCWPRVVLFGASLTQQSFSEDGCWGSIIADKLQRRCDVINRGFSGYNTSWCRMILPRLFSVENVKDIVAFTIFLGANDSNILEKSPQQHVPLQEYKANLMEMVEYLMTIGIAREKIILIGPSPCDVSALSKYLARFGTACGLDLAVLGQYAAACQEAAKESNVSHVELYHKLQEKINWENLFRDGLHFTTAGGKAVAELVWPEIEARVRHLPAMNFPAWYEVDWESPDNAFASW